MIGSLALPPPTSGTACHRVLTAIRQYFREHGCAPSFGEIERRTLVKRRNVGRTLRRLHRDGLVIYSPGSNDPIRLVDRAANLSDEELEAAVHGRGGRVDWSSYPALPEAFAADPRLPDDMAGLLAALP